MRIFGYINHGLLFLLAVSTALVKIAGLFTNKVAFEFELFANIGFNHTAVVLFGVVQLIGALLLLHRKTLPHGAILLLVTFVVATLPLLVVGNFAFGVSSLLFWAMALFCYRQNGFSKPQLQTSTA